MFVVKDGAIAPFKSFLSQVEAKIKENENADIGKLNFDEVKNKILEKVKGKKDERKQRRDSISSVTSTNSQGLKRRTSEEIGGDNNRKKTDVLKKPSAIPSRSSKQK